MNIIWTGQLRTQASLAITLICIFGTLNESDLNGQEKAPVEQLKQKTHDFGRQLAGHNKLLI